MSITLNNRLRQYLRDSRRHGDQSMPVVFRESVASSTEIMNEDFWLFSVNPNGERRSSQPLRRLDDFFSGKQRVYSMNAGADMILNKIASIATVCVLADWMGGNAQSGTDPA